MTFALNIYHLNFKRTFIGLFTVKKPQFYASYLTVQPTI